MTEKKNKKKKWPKNDQNIKINLLLALTLLHIPLCGIFLHFSLKIRENALKIINWPNFKNCFSNISVCKYLSKRGFNPKIPMDVDTKNRLGFGTSRAEDNLI